MYADVLAPRVVRTSAAMILPVQYRETVQYVLFKISNDCSQSQYKACCLTHMLIQVRSLCFWNWNVNITILITFRHCLNRKLRHDNFSCSKRRQISYRNYLCVSMILTISAKNWTPKRIVMLPTLSSLSVAVITTSGATGYGKVGILTTI